MEKPEKNKFCSLNFAVFRRLCLQEGYLKPAKSELKRDIKSYDRQEKYEKG